MKQIYTLLETELVNDSVMHNRIIVSAFVKANRLSVANNDLIKSLIIPKDHKYRHLIDNFCCSFTFEDLIKLFESVVPKDDAIVNGAVYTPDLIKEYIVSTSFYRGQQSINKPIEKWLCADISCGCGAFLYSLAKKIKSISGQKYSLIFKQIHGFDICKKSIARARILLSLLAIYEGEDIQSYDFNLHIGNSLSDMVADTLRSSGIDGYDVIVGNPPYVRSRNIDPSTKLLLGKWSVSSGNTDLYIPFFEVGLNSINKNGVLGYITVNTFFRSVNARMLRRYMQDNQYDINIIDFGQELIFEKKLAYTCMVFMSKTSNTHISYKKQTIADLACDDSNILYDYIAYKSLDHNKGWILNKSSIVNNIKKIENAGPSLGELYDIKNGIATLANSIYIFRPTSYDGEYFYCNNNGNTYKIEKDICQDIIKPNIVKSESDIDLKIEKIIFPYSDNVIIKETDFISRYPFAYKYLKDNKDKLDKRDKGKGKYAEWYAYGRTQALCNNGKKLLIPYMSDRPYAVYTDNEAMLIYCGYAIYSSHSKDLQILKKILESDVFEYYIKHTSKPYSTGYYSYAKNYIKHFGVYQLNDDQKKILCRLNEKEDINKFLLQLYDLSI